MHFLVIDRTLSYLLVFAALAPVGFFFGYAVGRALRVPLRLCLRVLTVASSVATVLLVGQLLGLWTLGGAL